IHKADKRIPQGTERTEGPMLQASLGEELARFASRLEHNGIWPLAGPPPAAAIDRQLAPVWGCRGSRVLRRLRRQRPTSGVEDASCGLAALCLPDYRCRFSEHRRDDNKRRDQACETKRAAAESRRADNDAQEGGPRCTRQIRPPATWSRSMTCPTRTSRP